MFFWKKKSENSLRNETSSVADSITSRKIRIASVEWRDGQQSLLATRIKTEDMLPILSQMDEVGYDSMEMWGGATFDTAIRYLGDDPWDRIRAFKHYVHKTPLRMLLRGQNLLGYKQYPDDIVNKFVELAANAGIDIFLIFDGLNDVRNTETAIKAALRMHKKAEANICYTISPAHTVEKYVQIAKDYAALGVSAIHVEDMAGMVTPSELAKAVRAIKESVDLPVHVQCHCTGGMADIAYWETVKAGADVLDCDVSSLALGTSHPATESIVAAFKDTSYDTKLNLELLESINSYVGKLREKYSQFASKFTGVNIGVLRHQIPGGMMSNLETQLKAMNAMSRINEIFDEIHVVHKDFGYPPLATPFAQMIGSQATFNVVMGERYKIMPKEVTAYLKGLYGRAPGTVEPGLMAKALGKEKLYTGRPADLLEPEWEKLKKKIQNKAWVHNEEDMMTYAMFPELGEPFLQNKYGK